MYLIKVISTNPPSNFWEVSRCFSNEILGFLVHNIRKVASVVVAKFLCLIPVYALPIVSKEVASTMLTNFSSIHPAIRACFFIMKKTESFLFLTEPTEEAWWAPIEGARPNPFTLSKALNQYLICTCTVDICR